MRLKVGLKNESSARAGIIFSGCISLINESRFVKNKCSIIYIMINRKSREIYEDEYLLETER